MYEWSVEKLGAKIHVDSKEFPSENLLVIDIETDETDRIVCIGLSGNGRDIYVYFYPDLSFYTWLLGKSLIGHELKGAEIGWLAKYGFSMSNVYMDTKIQAYVWDSARKKYGLKDLVNEVFNTKYPTYKEIVGTGKKKLTLDKQPRELVVQYNASDVYWTYKLYHYYNHKLTRRQGEFLQQIEMPMNKLLFDVERKGIKIDTKKVREIHNGNSKLRRATKRELIQIVGKDFNPNSPKQVLPILNRLGAKTNRTGEDDIKRFSHIPFVEKLLRYRGFQKLCSTYTIPLYTNAIKADDNRIHARFIQNTITGRLSSSDPINLQNQPAEVRSAFIAEAGHSLVDADWTNIELYLPAHFSGEPNFINELSKPDGDLHIQTAAQLFGMSALSGSDAGAKRQTAKTCNFLLTNSGSAKRLSVELGCSKKEAEDIYKKFWEGYPTLAAWLKETKRQARAQKGIGTLYGRWVSLPSLDSWCGRSNCPIFGNNGFFCKECFIREETERQAISIKVQGSASDLMKLAALRLRREYGYVPVALVHDALTYEEPIQAVEQVAQNVKYVMESICTLRVPLKAKVKIAPNWGEAH